MTSKSKNLANVYRDTHKTRNDSPSEAQTSNPFLDAFFAVDEDNSESITIDELNKYMKTNNFDQSFIRKWLTVFDLDGDGVITLEEFCGVLGLIPKNARIYRRVSMLQLNAGKNVTLPGDITLISASMDIHTQLDVIDIMREAVSQHSSEKDIVNNMKEQLDLKFGKLWHVIIVLGQYYASYSHEPNYSFFFKYKQYIFLIWKTPYM